jgi:hypothetical protein
MDEAGTIIAQQDSSPRDGAAPTSTWHPGEIIYDPHLLSLPLGDYTIGVRIYWYADPNKRLTVSGGDDFATIQVIHIE